MQKRRLGTSDLSVSLVGLGTVKFGRNQGVHYPSAFELPSDLQLQTLLATAAELGINLIDTAPAYGSSEARLGKLLINQRHHWVISTKVGETFNEGQSHFDFHPQAITASIERSLKRLNTDYLDIVLVHSNGDDVRLINEGVFETLAYHQQLGNIRAYGMSTKTIAGGLLAIEHADVAMIAFNQNYTDERKVIAYAIQQQKSIFIKKALGSGHLPAAAAIQFVCQEPGVTSVIIGTINAMHLRDNVASVC